ncbi:DUF2232 domain-containing protein [Clostridium perfringens]|nr:DUF2232 domain-containing protein [Clostridium perfringens]
MEQKFRSKSIVEAGIMAAITFVLMMLTSLPGIGQIIAFAVPIPIALLYLKYNLKTSICSIVISGVLIGFFMGPVYGVQAVITNGIIGLVLGTCVKKKLSGVKSFVYLILANTVGVIVEIGLMFSVFTGITFNQYVNELAKVFNEAAKISEQMVGTTPANAQMIEFMKSVDANFIITILPVAVVALIVLRAFLSYIVGKAIINNLGFKLNSLPPFSKWFFNPILIAVIVLMNMIIIYLVSKGIINNKGVYLVTLNVLFIILLIQGLAVISNLLKYKLKVNNFLIVFISILLVTSVPVLFTLLGIIDVLVDIRGVDPNSLGSYMKEKLKKKLQ